MRIVLAHKFYRSVGGTEEFVLQLTRLLESAGHEVVPFAMAHPDNWPSPYSSYFVPEIDYRKAEHGLAAARRAIRTIPRMFYSRDARRRFAALLRDVRPDLVHIQGIYHQISPSILYEASKAGLPVVQTVNDYKLVCPATALLNGRTHATCTKCLPRHYLHAVRDRCQDGSLALSAWSPPRCGFITPFSTCTRTRSRTSSWRTRSEVGCSLLAASPQPRSSRSRSRSTPQLLDPCLSPPRRPRPCPLFRAPRRGQGHRRPHRGDAIGGRGS